MPKVFSMARRLPTSAWLNERPKNLTIPPCNGCSPTMCRSNVLLPQPDGPMMKNISPRATVKLTSFNTTSSSYPAFRCSTSMAGIPAASFRGKPCPAASVPDVLRGGFSFIDRSPAQHVEDDRKQRVGHDNQKNRRDHGRRRRAAHAGRAPLRL